MKLDVSSTVFGKTLNTTYVLWKSNSPREKCGPSFFTQQTTHQPLLFIIEDLHWSDDTSLELLLYLARGCTHLPIFFVLTYRSDEVSPELRHYLAEFDREHLAQDFSLKRLARADVDAMLQAIFAMHQAAHTGLVESMYLLTEGNPFFVEEVLKSLIATGEITWRDGVWERTLLFGTHTRSPSIPRSVQDVVYQRTKQLSVPARQALTLAAVAGRRFDLTILRQVMHADESHMLVMFGLGVGNLVSMAVLTGVMVVEKTFPGGKRLSPVIGIALLLLAVLWLAHPAWLLSSIEV